MMSPFNHPRASKVAICKFSQYVSDGTGSLVVSPRLTGPQNLPVEVIVIRYQESASPSLLPGVCGKLWGVVTRNPRALRLPTFSRRYASRDLSRRVWNFCRALPGWSFGSLHQLRQKSCRILSISARPGPFVGALFHARNKSMEMNAWRAEKPSIRSVK